MLEKYEYGSAAKNLGFKRWRPDHGIATDKYEKRAGRLGKTSKRNQPQRRIVNSKGEDFISGNAYL